MEQANHREVQMILREFKTEHGSPNFPVLYNIPNSQRIRDLAKEDFQRVNMLIIGALTITFEGMNLKRGMNELQIINLSELIIESSAEDNLSFEDLMLFLQNMLMGKYQLNYESMDIPKFMQAFEIYRQERWKQWVEYNDNLHLQYKATGSVERTGTGENTVWQEALSSYTSKLQEKNETIKELREERKRNKKTSD